MLSNAPTTMPMMAEVAQPATNGPGHVFTKLIGTINVQPQAQPELSLGVFSDDNPAQGFAVEVGPMSDPESVETNITTLRSSNGWQVVLQITNHSDEPVRAEVWAR